MSTVAFIGLGAMGSRMAENLRASGVTLRVYNRDRAKTRPLAEQGVAVAGSPADAVKGADFVVSIVTDDKATRAVMLGDQGVIAAAAPGTIVLDSSTNSPALVKEIEAVARARGVHYLDAPVSGSLPQAQNRELVFLVGGDVGAIEKAEQMFAAMGKLARRIGGPGAGASLKLIVNTTNATLNAMLAEAMLTIEAADLDREAVMEIFSAGPFACRTVAGKVPKMMKRDFTAQFQLALMEKDVRYFLDMARELGCATPIAQLVSSQYDAACRANLGTLDTAAMFLQAKGERR